MACFLDDSCTSIGLFYLSFLGLGCSCTGVGFGLGDLGAVGTGVSSSMLTTSKDAPSKATTPLVLAVSPGLNMVLRINYWVSLSKVSNTELATKSMKT